MLLVSELLVFSIFKGRSITAHFFLFKSLCFNSRHNVLFNSRLITYGIQTTNIWFQKWPLNHLNHYRCLFSVDILKIRSADLQKGTVIRQQKPTSSRALYSRVFLQRRSQLLFQSGSLEAKFLFPIYGGLDQKLKDSIFHFIGQCQYLVT